MAFIGGYRTKANDVLLVVGAAGERLPDAGPTSVGFQVIEENLKASNCVILPKKEFSKLIDHFGCPWTEDAQYKISYAKQRHVLILAYRGDMMNALKHVNALLGGQVSFFSDDKRFTGSHIDVADTRGKQITNHSGRCFVVGLDTVDRFQQLKSCFSPFCFPSSFLGSFV